jgi:hypothetical protein
VTSPAQRIFLHCRERCVGQCSFMAIVPASSPRTAQCQGVHAVLASAPPTPLAISLSAPQCRNSLICARFVAPSMSTYLNCLLLLPCSPSRLPGMKFSCQPGLLKPHMLAFDLCSSIPHSSNFELEPVSGLCTAASLS